MNNELLRRIADGLDRIAVCLENKQLREIAIYKKSQITEKNTNNSHQNRATLVREKASKPQTIRVRTPRNSK